MIRETAPDATEKISYRMPTFTLQGNLVRSAAFKQHIGFYPCPSGGEELEEQLSVYKSGKGSLRFPLHEPMPLDLIRKVVALRVQANEAKAQKRHRRA